MVLWNKASKGSKIIHQVDLKILLLKVLVKAVIVFSLHTAGCLIYIYVCIVYMPCGKVRLSKRLANSCCKPKARGHPHHVNFGQYLTQVIYYLLEDWGGGAGDVCIANFCWWFSAD